MLEQAVFFDMDGVLIDSEPVWQDAIDRVLGSLGIVLDSEERIYTTGMGNVESVEWILARHPHVQAQVNEVCRQIDAVVLQRIQAGVGGIPGADLLVRDLAKEEVPLALVSTSGPSLMQAVVQAHHLDGLFRVVLSSEDVGPGKPHPAVYLEAIRRMKADPARSVAVEDTVNGARSAHGAGLRVIGFSREESVVLGMRPYVWKIASEYSSVRKHIRAIRSE